MHLRLGVSILRLLGVPVIAITDTFIHYYIEVALPNKELGLRLFSCPSYLEVFWVPSEHLKMEDFHAPIFYLFTDAFFGSFSVTTLREIVIRGCVVHKPPKIFCSRERRSGCGEFTSNDTTQSICYVSNMTFVDKYCLDRLTSIS